MSTLDTLRELGAQRVLEPRGALPQAALRLDTDPRLRAGELRIRIRTLNLDAASLRQLREKHHDDGNAVRTEVLEIIRERGKMHNPVTGSGGMLIGVVDEVHPEATAEVAVGDTVATLVSLTLTPLEITDGLQRWDGLSEQVPCEGHAVLFPRTSVVRLPEDLDEATFLSLVDVCGAPALTARIVREHRSLGRGDRVAVIGAAGKSGSLSLAAAHSLGCDSVALVRDEAEADAVRQAGLAQHVVVSDATDPFATMEALHTAGGPCDIVVVCVDAPGCEHTAILAAKPGGTVIFFSMATSFSRAALGAEGMIADVTMLIGNGYSPGHADYALGLLRSHPGVLALMRRRRNLDASDPGSPSPMPQATQRRYVSEQVAHYGDGLVAGAFSLELFGDVATELMIEESGTEGLFAAYESVSFLAPVQAGDIVEATARLLRRGRRSRLIDFTLTITARRVDGTRSRLLSEPILATTARGVVVIPRDEGDDS